MPCSEPAGARWRRFFLAPEAGSGGLQLRAPVLHILHQDLECTYAHPDGGPGLELMTDLRELDAVRGGEGKLRAALEAGLARGGDLAAVVVDSGCLPAAVGDDVPRVMREAANPKGVPLIFNDCSSGRDADVGRILFERIRAEAGPVRPPKVPSSVNLVGFPEGPALDELCALLKRAGVAVNARVLPAMTPDEARRLDAAEFQILMPDAAFEKAYEELFRPLEVPARTFAAPYGLEGTRRWLRSVAGLFGREAAAERAFAEARAPWADRWDGLRRRAAALKFAFVADRSELPRLKDAALLRGLPVLGLLREMGASAEILLFEGGGARGPVKGFKDPAELERLLREGAYDAVYSELAFDPRPPRAGAARLSPAVFEPGVRGAVATLGRLLALGRWSFYRRYAPYLRGERP